MKTPQIAAMIESTKKTGAPDPRVVSIMTRSEVGKAWVDWWNKVLYGGGVTAQAQRNVPHQDFGRPSVGLLLDRSVQRGQSGRAD